MIRRRRTVATLHDHSFAIADARVAGRAINVEALPAPRQHIHGYRKRHIVAGIVAKLAGVEIGVVMQLSACHGALDRRASRSEIGVKVALGKRLEARLIVHILAAACQEQHY